MFQFFKLFSDRYIQELADQVLASRKIEDARDQRKEILLTEYKEIISTLRNWDNLVYGMLTVVGTVIAAIITYSLQANIPIAWGIIFSLFLFWLFTYIWITKLAEIRIDVLIEIETELKMIGQYGRLRKIKQVKLFLIWVFLPYLSAFVTGPLLGFIIAHPDRFYSSLNNFVSAIRLLIR